jgi:hypothetical protein
MGMFDHITCKTALPVPKDRGELDGINWLSEEFQTKDLDSALCNYEIREDGTLWKKVHSSKFEHSKYTGSVTFYSFYMKENNDYWIEFIALFEDGKLIKDIKKHRWDVECNKERLEAEDRLTSHMKSMRTRYSTWRWRFLFLPWNRFVRWNTGWIRCALEWELRLVEKARNWLTIS